MNTTHLSLGGQPGLLGAKLFSSVPLAYFHIYQTYADTHTGLTIESY